MVAIMVAIAVAVVISGRLALWRGWHTRSQQSYSQGYA